MAKESSIVTISPMKFVPGLAYLVEDQQDVLRAANYAACETTEHHGSAVTGPYGWDFSIGTAIRGLNVFFNASPLWVQRFDYMIRVGSDAQFLRFAVQVYAQGADSCSVRILVDGVVVATIAGVVAAANGLITSVAFAAPAAGDHNVTIELNGNTGSGTSSLVWFGLGEDGIDPTTLPDPSG